MCGMLKTALQCNQPNSCEDDTNKVCSTLCICRLAEIGMACSMAVTSFCFGKHRYRSKAKRKRQHHIDEEQTKC